MKRVFAVLLSLVLLASVLVAQPIAEEPSGFASLGVMSGPTGFSSAGLERFLSSDELEVEVFPSPNEVIARLANGELDLAALPSNVAANLYNKGVGIRVAAIIGDGMLSILSSDSAVTSVTDLIGKTIHVPGPGSTPDQMAQLLIREANLVLGEDVILDYSIAAPAQLAQMVIAGRVSLAVMPEPFVTMIMRQNPAVTVAADVQQLYRELTSVTNYPMSVLVVSDSFAQQQPRLLAKILNAYEQSVQWVNANHTEAGVAIEKATIMTAAMATPAIGSCNLVWRTGDEAARQLTAYYSFLHAFSPDAIGGDVPPVDLYR
jgi:NitT/TauT family transport system substrate-binding protein